MWPTWFDEATDIPVAITIATAFFTGIFWVINQKMTAIKAEMQPNHGSSMRDAVDRLEIGMAEVKTVTKEAHAVALRVEQRQNDHLEWHLTHKETPHVRAV